MGSNVSTLRLNVLYRRKVLFCITGSKVGSERNTLSDQTPAVISPFPPSRSAVFPRASLLVALAAGLAGCGAAHGFDGQVYRAGPVAFRIADVPAGWKQVDVDAAPLAFRDEA